jgi:hypothetical protein
MRVKNRPCLLYLLLFWSVTVSAQQNQTLQESALKQSTIFDQRIFKLRELDSLSTAINAGRALGTRQKVSDWAVIGGLFGLPIGFGLPWILDNQSHDPPARLAIGAAIALGVTVVAAPLFVDRVTIPDSLKWIKSKDELARGYQRGYASAIVPRRQISALVGSAIGTAVGALLFFSLLHAAYGGE